MRVAWRPEVGRVCLWKASPCESVEVLWSSPLSDPVMVQWPWVCSASWAVNIVLSGYSVSAVLGRHSPRHRRRIHRSLLKATELMGTWARLGAVLLFTDIGDNAKATFWRCFYVLKVNPSSHSPLLSSDCRHLQQFFFFSLFATECHCCSAVLQPLSPPFVCTEVERHKLTGSECKAAAGQIIALSPTAVARPHRLFFAPLPLPAPETRWLRLIALMAPHPH